MTTPEPLDPRQIEADDRFLDHVGSDEPPANDCVALLRAAIRGEQPATADDTTRD